MALKLACAVLLMCMVTAPIAEAAITCGQVTSSLQSCINYLKVGGNVPPPCCAGIKRLIAAAVTKVDRQTACNCLKQAATNIKGIDLGRANGLPGKCGASIPYPINPSTDCSKVQ